MKNIIRIALIAIIMLFILVPIALLCSGCSEMPPMDVPSANTPSADTSSDELTASEIAEIWFNETYGIEKSYDEFTVVEYQGVAHIIYYKNRVMVAEADVILEDYQGRVYG